MGYTQTTTEKSNKKEVIIIDREQENRDIATFQKTGDLEILERVFVNRIPTLKSWAQKHYYPGLTTSVDDLFGDLCIVFLKAAEKYDISRGASFNTCLFTFLLNRLKNIKSSKHAKKRLPDEYEGPAIGMILSLDYSYNTSDGAEVTLKDIIPSCNPNETDYVLTNTYMDETLNVLSNDDPELKTFLSKIGDGNSLVALMREYKLKKGTIKVSRDQAMKLKNGKNKNKVKNLIKQEIDEDFKLLGYEIEGTSRLRYEVELNKTEKTDRFMKSIREIRKNKDIYRDKIAGVA